MMSINRPAKQLALRTLDLTVSVAYVTALDSTNQHWDGQRLVMVVPQLT